MSNIYVELENVLKKIEDDDIVLVGLSMGSIIASYAAAKFNVSKLVLVVSPYQFGTGDDVSEFVHEWKAKGVWQFQSSSYGRVELPYSFIDDAHRFNALEVISRVMCPKLFIVGEADQRVPLSLTKKLYELATEPKTWKMISKMKHDYKRQNGMTKLVNDYILEFPDCS